MCLAASFFSIAAWRVNSQSIATPITDSIDSSNISCSHNNLGRRDLEVQVLDPLLLLRTENLQPRRLGSRVLFPPQWLSLHLGTGSRPTISSSLLQPFGEADSRHRLSSRVQLSTDLPEHFRRAALQFIPARSLSSHFQGQRPLCQQELARQQRNLGFSRDHRRGLAHQSHIFNYPLV